jgi:arylsulfatase A-like enzyme
MLAERSCSAAELELVGDLYDAALFDLDRRTGLLLDELERRGLLEQTVVVLTSDHGENLGERGLFDHKFCAYDTLLRVPLIVRYPRRLPPGRVERTVSLLDVHASLLEVAGLSAPNPGAIGVSLWSSADGRAVCAEELASFPKLLLRSAKDLPELDLPRWSRTFQTIERGGKKLIRHSDGAVELYDVGSDPAERQDLSASDPGRVRSLSEGLDRWLASFPHLDPATQVKERRRSLPEDVQQHLQALGYYDQE